MAAADGARGTPAAQAGEDAVSSAAVQALALPLVAATEAAVQACDDALVTTGVAALLDTIERPGVLAGDALSRVAALGVTGARATGLELSTRGHCSQVQFVTSSCNRVLLTTHCHFHKTRPGATIRAVPLIVTTCVAQLVNWLVAYKPKQLVKTGHVRELAAALASLTLEPDQHVQNGQNGHNLDGGGDGEDEELAAASARAFACRALDGLALGLPSKHVLPVALEFVAQYRGAAEAGARVAALAVAGCATIAASER